MQSGRADILCSCQMFHRGFAWEQVPEVILPAFITTAVCVTVWFIVLIWIAFQIKQTSSQAHVWGGWKVCHYIWTGLRGKCSISTVNVPVLRDFPSFVCILMEMQW